MNDQQPQPQADLQAKPAILTAVIEIKRAATGKVETYTITGTALPPEEPKEQTP